MGTPAQNQERKELPEENSASRCRRNELWRSQVKGREEGGRLSQGGVEFGRISVGAGVVSLPVISPGEG